MLEDIVIFSGVLINKASMNCILWKYCSFFFKIVHGSIVLLMIIYAFNLLVNTSRAMGLKLLRSQK